MNTNNTGYPSIDRVHLADVPKAKLHPKIETASLFGAFKAVNATSMDSPEPLIERDGKVLTKREFEAEVLAVAAGLIHHGFSVGDTMVIYTSNLIESLVLTFAANAIGLRVAYANSSRPLDHAIETVNDHDAKILVATGLSWSDTQKIRDQVHSLRMLIETTWTPPLAGKFFRTSYSALKRVREDVPPKLVAAEIMSRMSSEMESIFLQTSGSTANAPKILPFTNRNVIAALTYMTNGTNQTTNDQVLKKGLSILPFNHPYGWAMIVANLIGGNHIELIPDGSLDDIGNWYQKRANFIYGTPQILRELIAKTPERADLSPLKAFFSAGLKTEEELFNQAEQFFRAHGSEAEVRNNYGMGETLCIGTTSDGVPHRPNTCGKPYPGLELYIVDEDLCEVKYDEAGELLVWTESMVTHYFKNDPETAKSFITFQGKTFFRTGDIGSLSRDNYLTLLGRKKRFYQPRGANDKVNCETIETVLTEIDFVAENAVTIYKLTDGSESSAAFVVLKSGTLPTDETRHQITTFLGKHLRRFELPTKILFVASLPLLSSGKINYQKLTEIAD